MGLSPSQGTARIPPKSTEFKPTSGSAENPLQQERSRRAQLLLPLGFPYPRGPSQIFPFPIHPQFNLGRS